jgi:hypothetical protein
VPTWHRQYNVSGTVHCDHRLDDWCAVLCCLLHTDDVGVIGHYTGAVSVFAFSPVADIVSCGFDIHDFWALVHGDPAGWRQFSDSLSSALTAAKLRYSQTVHEAVQIRP